MKLTEIYLRERVVKDIEIPKKWQKSFNKFMIGQGCGIYENENGRGYKYWYADFAKWYRMNEKSIKRDEQIDSILG